MFSIDPSKGRNQKGDYSAIVCSAVTSDLTYVDSDIRRRPPSQIVEGPVWVLWHPLHRIGRGSDWDRVAAVPVTLPGHDLNYAKDHPQMALSIYGGRNILIPVEDPLPKPLHSATGPATAGRVPVPAESSNSILLMQLKQFNGRNEQFSMRWAGTHDTLLPIRGKRLAEGKDDGPDAPRR